MGNLFQKRIRITILLCLLVFSDLAALNPLIATYTLDKMGDTYQLEMALPQTSVDQTLENHYPEVKFDKMNKYTYQTYLLEYLQKDLDICINNQSVQFSESEVQVDNQQISVKFILLHVQDDIQEMRVEIPHFSEYPIQTNLFNIQINGDQQRYLLNAQNDYTLYLEVGEGGILQEKEALVIKYFNVIMAVILAIFIGGACLIYLFLLKVK